MQIGRTTFTVYALTVEQMPVARNFVRMGCWLALSGAFWIGGALDDPQSRLWWWSAGAAIDLLGPAFGHRVPGLGKTATNDWDIVGSHLSERCALFIIIALGEVIIVLGQTYAAASMSLDRTAALVVTFVGCAILWWIYFDVGAKRGMQRIEEEDNPARVARVAYTWLHMPIVFGIVLIAVADKKVLGAPMLAASNALAFLAIGGSALFLAGEMAFKNVTAKSDRLPRSHLAGIAALAALAPFATSLSGLALVAATTAILLGVAVLERVLRSEPTPHADDPRVIVEVEA